MWAFGGSAGSARAANWKQDAPKTPRKRSQSKDRKGKAKGSGKGKDKGGKSGDYAAGSGQAPWQSSSLLQSMGITPVDLAPKSPAPSKEPFVDGILSGLRQHLKAIGQELNPEIESYLLKKTGNNPQAVKQASNRLEAAQKTTVKLKAELNQLTLGWQKFTAQLEKEFDQQKERFMEKKAALQRGIKTAEEEMVAAQDALKDAAASHRAAALSTDEELNGATAQGPPNANVASPKRTGDGEKEDALAKKLKSADVINVEDMEVDGVDLTRPPGFG